MELLFDEKYQKAAAALMAAAKKEVFIIGFQFTYPFKKKHKITDIFYDGLLSARARGLVCRIIMNYTTPENTISRENKVVSSWLRSNDIECKHMPRNRCVHAKMLVIDGTTTVLGSHNFTQRAFSRNLEASVSIDNSHLALQAKEHFLKLWAQAVLMPQYTDSPAPK